MNNKIVSRKKSSAIFLAIVLVAGTITAISPTFMIGAQGEPYYGMDNSYDDRKPYGMDNDRKSYDNSYKSQYQSYKPDYKPAYQSYGKDDKRDESKDAIIKKIKCINTNLNINGENAGNVSIGNKGEGYQGANSYSMYYDGYNNNKQGKGFDDCVINNNNNNNNTNINVGVGGGNQTIPPEPEPTTATLTVKKQVFGCNNIIPMGPQPQLLMDCPFQNTSTEWLNCNDNNNPAGVILFCQSLPESFFDIEVLDDQNSQIQQFEGSEQGTTIENLEPGTYTVNEIEHLSNIDQLGENDFAEVECTETFLGFPDGGILVNTTSNTNYFAICFEYVDEQGNDCNTVTLAAEEEKTCIVKNYIRFALDS